MKHRLQGDKRLLQAMVGGRGSFLPGFGGALVLQMVFSFSLLQHTVLGIQGDAQSRCEKEPYQPSFVKIRA